MSFVKNYFFKFIFYLQQIRVEVTQTATQQVSKEHGTRDKTIRQMNKHHVSGKAWRMLNTSLNIQHLFYTEITRNERLREIHEFNPSVEFPHINIESSTALEKPLNPLQQPYHPASPHYNITDLLSGRSPRGENKWTLSVSHERRYLRSRKSAHVSTASETLHQISSQRNSRKRIETNRLQWS